MPNGVRRRGQQVPSSRPRPGGGPTERKVARAATTKVGGPCGSAVGRRAGACLREQASRGHNPGVPDTSEAVRVSSVVKVHPEADRVAKPPPSSPRRAPAAPEGGFRSAATRPMSDSPASRTPERLPHPARRPDRPRRRRGCAVIATPERDSVPVGLQTARQDHLSGQTSLRVADIGPSPAPGGHAVTSDGDRNGFARARSRTYQPESCSGIAVFVTPGPPRASRSTHPAPPTHNAECSPRSPASRCSPGGADGQPGRRRPRPLPAAPPAWTASGPPPGEQGRGTAPFLPSPPIAATTHTRRARRRCRKGRRPPSSPPSPPHPGDPPPGRGP